MQLKYDIWSYDNIHLIKIRIVLHIYYQYECTRINIFMWGYIYNIHIHHIYKCSAQFKPCTTSPLTYNALFPS